jgi:hypothetical protein
MSAIDICLDFENNTYVSSVVFGDARAELAALRAELAGDIDALHSWCNLWTHICTVTNCTDYLPSESNFDAMLEQQITALQAAALRARVTELEAVVGEARKLVDQSLSDLQCMSNVSDEKIVVEMIDHLTVNLVEWLAAHPAPEEVTK